MAAPINGRAATAQLVSLFKQQRTPSTGDRLEAIRRGLLAASDRLAALHRCRHKLGAEALAQQLAGLHREAQQLAFQLGEQAVQAEADHDPAA